MRNDKNYCIYKPRKIYRIPSIVIVYLMQVGDSDIYKIGHTSKEIEVRMRGIRVHVPDIKLISITRCSVNNERGLHELFAHKNIPFLWFREYFKLKQTEVNFIINHFKRIDNG